MSIRIFLLLFLYLAAALPASADVVRPLSGKISVGELRGACSSAGGSFVVHADGGGYGCMKENCDGKGGTCHVACDNNNNCNGSTPTRINKALTLVGILQDGNTVVRDPAPAAPGSLVGGLLAHTMSRYQASRIQSRTSTRNPATKAWKRCMTLL